MDFPAYLEVGPWSIHPHPVFEALAYALGFQVFLALRRQAGDPVQHQRPWLVLAAIAGALVGAKVVALLVDPSALWAGRAEPLTWIEGKSIVGGLLGGLVAVEATKKVLGIRAATGDLYAIPLTLGIAIGRLGCFLTGLDDRTYGDPTSLPWGVDFGDGVARHPTPLYEVGFVLLVLLPALVWLRSRPHVAGDQFKLFMVGYLAWRLLVDFIQPGWTLIGLSTIQWACLAGLAYYAPDVARLTRLAVPRRPVHG